MALSIDSKVGHSDVVSFAESRVNLPREDVLAYREQARNLRARLERHIELHPGFDLVKIRESGSVPKGTALRTVSDMDLAVYVRRAAAPERTPDLVGWLVDRLRSAYSFLDPSQIVADDTCVRISYRGTGIDVELVPVLYDDDPNDYGEVILRGSGRRVRTSIPRHLAFIRRRKDRHPQTFAQLIRLLKFWRKARLREGALPLSAFGLELIVAHCVDHGLDPSDYPAALEAVFAYIVKSGLRERIAFTDNYAATALPRQRLGPVEIIDPVNANNNVAEECTERDRQLIVEVAHDALDDITLARTASTKEDAIAYFRSLFGSEFSI